MQNSILDKFDDQTADTPTSYDYAVLYAKYVGVCCLVGFFLGGGLFLGVQYPLNRVAGMAIFALAILLFVFALIGTFHSFRSFWRKEEVSRVRFGVTLLHVLVVLGYFSYLVVVTYAVINLNPTGIS